MLGIFVAVIVPTQVEVQMKHKFSNLFLFFILFTTGTLVACGGTGMDSGGGAIVPPADTNHVPVVETPASTNPIVEKIEGMLPQDSTGVVTYVDGSHLNMEGVPMATPIPHMIDLQPGQYQVLYDRFYVNFGTEEGTQLFYIWNQQVYHNTEVERDVIANLYNQMTLSAEDLEAIKVRHPAIGYQVPAVDCFQALGYPAGLNIPVTDSSGTYHEVAMIVVSGKSFNWTRNDDGSYERGSIRKCMPHYGNPSIGEVENQMNFVLKNETGTDYLYMHMWVQSGNQGFLQPVEGFAAFYNGAVKSAVACSTIVLKENAAGFWHDTGEPGGSPVYIDMNQSYSVRDAAGRMRSLSCYPKTQLEYQR